MECQEIRQLLAFFERKTEELDAVERDALQKHLDACPDCAALTAQERGIDQAIGAALREVPIPAGLKQQVLQRLAVERGGTPWKGWAIAAVLLVAIGGVTSWYFLHRPTLTMVDVANTSEVADAEAGWTRKGVEHRLEEQGLSVSAPDRFDYQYLQQVDVVEIRGRRVARLNFRNDGQNARATVFIIDQAKFDIDQLKDQTGIEVRTGEFQQAGFTYVIHWNAGDRRSLEKQFQ